MAYTQSYLGMPTPQAVGESQNAAQQGTSSIPRGGAPGPQPKLGGGESSAVSDYSGGSPYLTGLNYGPPGNRNPLTQPITSFGPGTGQVAAPPPLTAGQTQGQQQIPGSQLPQVQYNAQGDIVGQSAVKPPPALANIPNIRYMSNNGAWSDGEGRLYNPNTGAVIYDPGGAGYGGAGFYFGGAGGPSQTQPGNFQQLMSLQQQPGGGMSGPNYGGATNMRPQAPQGQSLQNMFPNFGQANGMGTYASGGVMGPSGAMIPQGPQAIQPGQNPLTQPMTQFGASTSPQSINPLAQPIQSYEAGTGEVGGGAMGQAQGWSGNQPMGGGQAVGQAIPGPMNFPNTYGGGFQNYPQQTYTPNPFVGNTPPPTMFSGNNGPQQGAVGRPPEGYGVVPPFSPAMSQLYFQYLMNQVGQGATPYGQQNTFLPSQGQSGMTGLSAPMSPFAQYAQNALTSHIGNIGNQLDPANLQAMMAQYGGLINQAGMQSQYGARGNPGDPNGLYTGAQALQGSASGVGLPGLPGQYLNSAMQYGGMGLPAQTQSAFAQYGAGPGAGGTTLSNMAQTGQPTDVGPAWEAMKSAQQRNIDQQAAQIRERMGLSGNLGLTSLPGGGTGSLGTPYGTALTDFYSQTAKDQNATLAQASQQAQEQARQRMLGAAGTMSGQQLGAAQNLGALQQQAGLFGAGQQTANSQYLQNLMAQGLGQQGQLTAMQQQIPSQIYQQYLQQMGGQIGNALNLGQQYQGLDQNAINRQYQEFLRTQPEYSPLLQQLFAGATTFPGIVSTRFGAGGIPTAIGQGLGQGLGALGQSTGSGALGAGGG